MSFVYPNGRRSDEPLIPAYIEWQKNLLHRLRVDGIWIAPSSGVRVTKRSDSHVTIGGPDGWHKDITRRYVQAAGYTVDNEGPDDAQTSQN